MLTNSALVFFIPSRSLATPPSAAPPIDSAIDRKSTRLNSSHSQISYAVFCLKKQNARVDEGGPRPQIGNGEVVAGALRLNAPKALQPARPLAGPTPSVARLFHSPLTRPRGIR